MWENTDMVLMTSQAAIGATSSCGVDRRYQEREGNTLVPATPPVLVQPPQESNLG